MHMNNYEMKRMLRVPVNKMGNLGQISEMTLDSDYR